MIDNRLKFAFRIDPVKRLSSLVLKSHLLLLLKQIVSLYKCFRVTDADHFIARYHHETLGFIRAAFS